MQKLFLFVCLSVLFFVPSGCAKYWYQEGKSFDECNHARAECFEALKKRTDFSSPTVEYELKYMNECMQAKGYREVSAKELPLEVRREEPETSLHWRTRGIAGTVAEP
jgi:hypothetical protein